MKRRQLLNHLAEHGCELYREGANHSIYRNTSTGKRTAVPRHGEIANVLARKICKDLGAVPPS